MDLEREVGWVERETACRGQREDEPMEFGLGRVERERDRRDLLGKKSGFFCLFGLAAKLKSQT